MGQSSPVNCPLIYCRFYLIHFTFLLFLPFFFFLYYNDRYTMMTCVGPAVRHDALFYPTTDMLCIALVIYFINKCLFIIL